MNFLPLLLKDFYKVDHRRQYPKGVTKVYSNFTPRVSRIPDVKYAVVFGVQYLMKRYLIEEFNRNFFAQSKRRVLDSYRRRMDHALGKSAFPLDHIEALYDLGHLPLLIKALPEGTRCPLRVPMLTITNTHPDFAWMVNDTETLLSCELWHPMTVATIADAYRHDLEWFADRTGADKAFVKWQGHDFSFRGATCVEAAAKAGAAHLLSFTGTDTIPAIDFLEDYYYANAEDELIGGSVPATEHAVMCLGGKETEVETFRRLIEDVYPSGLVSIVSDTWDFWKVLTETIPQLKAKILARDGKVVIRPDSGDPVKILCGDPASDRECVNKGAVEVLWDIFGGTKTAQGYKQLDPHIGLIYGDSITREREREICKRLMDRGFASSNVVFGIGSYTYQYNTRDTLGFAMKATFGEIDGQSVTLYKAPATDDGTKNSARGLLMVDEFLNLHENVSPEVEATGLLQPVFKDGVLMRHQSLFDIRNRMWGEK